MGQLRTLPSPSMSNPTLSHTTIISDSLEQCAAIGGDITEAVYERFFALSAAAGPLMAHSDNGMQGRMLAQVLELMLTDEHLGEQGYLRWEVDNHLLAYGVSLPMYDAFFQALQDTVRDTLRHEWRRPQAQAWASRIETLLADINKHSKS